MWSYMVAPPPLQAEFGVARADASLPCTFVMIRFATGGVLMGRLADHFGVAVPVAIMFRDSSFGVLRRSLLTLARIAESAAGISAVLDRLDRRADQRQR